MINRSNPVAETKALISLAVTASLFSHMQKNAFFMTGFEYSNIIKKNSFCNHHSGSESFFDIMSQKDEDRIASIVNPDGTDV